MKTVWLGEAVILGYDVVVITDTQAEAKRLLLNEHDKRHCDAGTGVHAKSWRDLQERCTEASVRAIEMGKVIWP